MDDDDNKSENTDDDVDNDKDADGRGGFCKCDRRCYFCIIITVWSIASCYAVGMSCCFCCAHSYTGVIWRKLIFIKLGSLCYYNNHT